MKLPDKDQTRKLQEASLGSGAVRIKPGVYHYKIKNAEVTRARTSGAEMLKLQLRITDHPDRPVIFSNVMLEGDASMRWVHFVASCGWDLSSTDEDDLIGLTGLCQIDDNEYQGKVRSQVRLWLPPPNPSGNSQPTPAAPATSTAPPKEEEEEDDLPMSSETPPPSWFNGEKMSPEEIVGLVQAGKANLTGEDLRQWLAQQRGEISEEKSPQPSPKTEANEVAKKLIQRVKEAKVVDV